MTATSLSGISQRNGFLVLMLLLWWQPVTAATPLVSLQFETLELAAVQLNDVSIRLDDPVDGGSGSFSLTAARVQLSPTQIFTDLHLQCEGRIEATRLVCQRGRLSLEHPQLGPLQSAVNFEYAFAGGLQQVRLQELTIAGARLEADLSGPAAQWRVMAEFAEAPVEELRSFIGLAGIESTPGILAGKVSGIIKVQGWPVQKANADLTLAEVNYSATSVAQSLAGRIRIALQRDGDSWEGELNLAADGGELYIVPPVTADPPGFYIAIGERPLMLNGMFSYLPNTGTLIAQDMEYTHPGVINVNLAGRAHLVPAFQMDALSLRIPDSDLARLYPVYLRPWLLDTAYNDLEMGGSAAIEIGLRGEALTALMLQFNAIDMTDKNGRFAIRDLTTDIQMTETREYTSRVSWDGIDLYRIGFGSGAITLASHGFNIEVTEWQDVPLLDGRLHIAELDLRGVGTPDFTLQMAGAVSSVSLPALTRALDWPTLGGNLHGEFSGLTYHGGDIRMNGELLVRMFDGRVSLRNLNASDLFGSLPVLTANIGVQDISLERLTDTFAFGKITGKLGGYIRNLRLEDWQPVAFDARLSTLDDGNTRHRISQKALNNLSQIGGGLSGALSRGFLRYFDEYSYGELGLSCRLEDGFCELGGVESYKGGHYLLTRGGLLPPWVEVKLAGSIISWDALIEGFGQMAQGEVKIN